MSEDQFNRLSESDKNFWTLLQKNLPIYRKCKLYRDADEVYRRLLDQKKQQGEKS